MVIALLALLVVSAMAYNDEAKPGPSGTGSMAPFPDRVFMPI